MTRISSPSGSTLGGTSRKSTPSFRLREQSYRLSKSTGELSQRFGASGRHLIRSLRAIAYGFSAKSKVKVPGFAEVEASFVAKDMIDRDERLTPDPLLDRSLYFGAFNSLEDVKLREKVRIVVLIDDLDRCFPDQAIRLLESIKLVLAQPGFIFILGVARQVVEGYLQHRYTKEMGSRTSKVGSIWTRLCNSPSIFLHQPVVWASSASTFLPVSPQRHRLNGLRRADLGRCALRLVRLA